MIDQVTSLFLLSFPIMNKPQSDEHSVTSVPLGKQLIKHNLCLINCGEGQEKYWGADLSNLGSVGSEIYFQGQPEHKNNHIFSLIAAA